MSIYLFTVLVLTVVSQPALSQALINEVDADQTGTDNAEFIELYGFIR